jgi:short subunit dehydrogenase-like uncharacterized protein
VSQSRDFDIVVHGASGFTGRLVAEYLATRAEGEPSLRWAMSGRSLDKLAAVRAEMGVPDSVPVIEADASNPASLRQLAGRARVVLTTVGPYQLYGSALVAACADAGTAYVDLCGEPAWMRDMIDRHEARAKSTRARIVFSCGFDSIPFDLGVLFLQEACRQRFGMVAPRVRGRVRKMKGTFSGGTAASLRATMEAAADPAVLALLRNPFSLTPGFEGPKQPPGNKPYFEESSGVWLAPFIMAPINTRNIHRSNLLMGHPYGRDFVYEEMLVTGPGERGEQIAQRVAGDKSLMSDTAPKPGEGPSKAEREAGLYDLQFIADMPDGESLSAIVTGNRDPGYGSTSKMVAEAALSLARDLPEGHGGIFTPASGLGLKLVSRLTTHAGLTFTLE